MTTTSLGGKTGTDIQQKDESNVLDGLSRRTALSVIGLGTLGVVASSPGQAAPNEQCFTVNGGQIEGQLTSPTTTAGTLKGAGPLNGSTALSIEHLVPSAGLPPSKVPSATVSYTGVFTITTNHGEVTLRDVGIFDSDVVNDGEFTSRGRVIDGTDRWEDASGVLFFWGDVNADGTFTAEANGTICIPK